jgi:peptidyl-prolyl cis-trans isomerase B (cyclophilin B)
VTRAAGSMTSCHARRERCTRTNHATGAGHRPHERRCTALSTHPDSKEIIMVELHTNHGVIKLELDAEKAPKSVENFLAYVKAGHYDNTVFHRVIDGFMIQGGGFEPGMTQKPTNTPIANEANNGLKNVKGSIAMARTNDPHSATAQFFINVNDNDFLNHSSPTPQGWGYAVFGKVVEGLEVVDAIRKVKTGSKGFHQDVPADDVIIEKAVVVE